jgi:hypothetical protein
MRRLNRWLGLAMMVLPGAASAQYMVEFALTQTGPATCGGTSIEVPVSGTVTYNLPLTADNLIGTFKLDGVVVTQGIQTVPGPFPNVQVIVGATLPLGIGGLRPQPYTYEQTQFPASNGVPVGTGLRITGICNADNTASVTFVNGIPTAATAVPLLGPPLLAALGALLVLSAGAIRGRRRQLGG